jgi:hypothetical protein
MARAERSVKMLDALEIAGPFVESLLRPIIAVIYFFKTPDPLSERQHSKGALSEHQTASGAQDIPAGFLLSEVPFGELEEDYES